MTTNFNLPLTGAIVIVYEDRRPDAVALMTDLFDPLNGSEGNLYFDFKCPHGTGAEYVRTTFSITAEVSRIPKPRTRFSR